MISYFLPFNILIIFVFVTSTNLVFSFPNNVTDHQALLSFKHSITGPSGVLDSWNNFTHFCHWTGITCSRRRQRVTVLELSSLNLTGTLSPYIGNLSFLRAIYLNENNFHGIIPNEIGRLRRLKHLSLEKNSFEGRFPANLSHCVDIRIIYMGDNNLEGELPQDFASWAKLDWFDLSDNHFSGSLPLSLGNMSSLRTLLLSANHLSGIIPNEIGRLFRLQYLFLDNNFFQGVFPVNLSHCVDIETFSLHDNNLDGELPTDFASWSKLDGFDISTNHFTGSIPPSIGNISSLRFLFLRKNNLVGGIPSEVAHHTKLEVLGLSLNSLSGLFPLPLYNISSIHVISLTDNVLEGTLPSDLGFTLPKLQILYVGGNGFFGTIPPSIVNASNLIIFSIPDNSITGPIPNNLGSLHNLEILALNSNPLGYNMGPGDMRFIDSLVNCTNLKTLNLYNTSLTGQLPNTIVNLSTTMERLYVDMSHIYGSIPREIGKLVNLKVLALGVNLLTGTIPESIGKLSKLSGLYLSYNNISGVIPTSISNITQLFILSLESNMLQGSIPPELFNISTIQELHLADNRLRGIIPEEIVFSSQCIFLNLSRNLLSGPLPSNLGSLRQLFQLDVSCNKLTGNIPTTLGECVMLEELYMDRNLFHGRIPSSLKSLRSLRILDLSSNNISGYIPKFFEVLHLIEFLNLSHNKLSGEVPREGLFSNISAFSIVGNFELCGGVQAFHLPACPVKASSNKKKKVSLRTILILVLVPLGILLALISYRRRNSKKLNDPAPVLKDDLYPKLSYQDLLLATNEFSPNSLLGEGRYSSVYKGVLESVEHILAVKVLNFDVQGANKTFLAECETLRHIRHRNLIKIITACSSTDFKGNDFKALVFEFMANGSVDHWLHPSPSDQGNERNLTLLQRLNISIDVAVGVDYLHNHTHASIIHCDLKPSNVLLDKDYVARIGDFGLARFCFATTSDINQSQMSSTGVRGTIGYVPPEYGMGADISAEGDVYSYGIFVLEMFSGKRPTCSSALLDNNNSLHDYVKKALPQRVMNIVDPRIIIDQEEHGLRTNQSYSKATSEVCLASIFQVGVLCSVEMPKERIGITVAIKQLHAARAKLMQHSQ